MLKDNQECDVGIIDIEASDLHFDSYPIEVAVRFRGECKSWLIKPEPSWQYWCATAESMHGISRKELFRDGLSAIKVAKQLNAFLTESDVVLYSDAHRWDGDYNIYGSQLAGNQTFLERVHYK